MPTAHSCPTQPLYPTQRTSGGSVGQLSTVGIRLTIKAWAIPNRKRLFGPNDMLTLVELRSCQNKGVGQPSD